MQFVSSRDVREGMCVAEDVRDQHGRTLIARGQRLGAHHIVRLRKFGIQAVFIDPNNGEGYQKPTRSELRDECQKVLNQSFSQLTSQFAEKKIALDPKSIQSAADKLVDSLSHSRNSLITLLDVSTSTDRMMQHSVNTAVLATALGVDLHLPEPMLKDIAAAMLFHDIGMIFLPDTLTQRTTPVTPQEIPVIRKHPEMGIDHLVRSNAISNVAANIVLNHHENLDGTGYPGGVGGDKLSLLIRIANVVEIYDSLTMPRFGIPPVMPDAAITYLIMNAGRRFAKEAVIALAKRIALYPVGSAVQLSTGEYAVVAGVLPTAPTRPVVLIQQDIKGNRLKDPMVVDLVREPGRGVIRSAPNLEMLIKSREPIHEPKPIDPAYASLG